MKILFITHQLSNETVKINSYINNTVSDMVLHGLKNVYGKDVIDYPGAWYMFKDEVKKKSFDITNLWAKGFTYYNEFDNYDSVDRSDIESKIDNNYFEYIIYGSIDNSQKYLDKAINSKSKIIFIDGSDNTNLEFSKNKKIILFKRELNKRSQNIYPLNICIPKNKIIKSLNKKPTNLLAPLIPYRYKTYVYKKESDYYDMWQNSIFGIAHPPPWGNWWESVKYYEMLMNGCIPLFLNLKNCPAETLTLLPKKELIDIYNNYSWILSKYFPFTIYRKEYLTADKVISYIKNILKRNYSAENFIQKFPEINNVRNNLVEYTKKYLTTEYLAKYIVNTAKDFYSS